MVVGFEFMQRNLSVSFRCFARVHQKLWSKSNLYDFIILIRGLVSCPLSQSISNLIPVPRRALMMFAASLCMSLRIALENGRTLGSSTLPLVFSKNQGDFIGTLE